MKFTQSFLVLLTICTWLSAAVAHKVEFERAAHPTDENSFSPTILEKNCTLLITNRQLAENQEFIADLCTAQKRATKFAQMSEQIRNENETLALSLSESLEEQKK